MMMVAALPLAWQDQDQCRRSRSCPVIGCHRHHWHQHPHCHIGHIGHMMHWRCQAPAARQGMVVTVAVVLVVAAEVPAERAATLCLHRQQLQSRPGDQRPEIQT